MSQRPKRQLTIKRLMALVAICGLIFVICFRVVPWTTKMIDISRLSRAILSNWGNEDESTNESIDQLREAIKSTEKMVDEMKTLGEPKEQIKEFEGYLVIYGENLAIFEKMLEDSKRMKAKYQRAVWRPWTLGR